MVITAFVRKMKNKLYDFFSLQEQQSLTTIYIFALSSIAVMAIAFQLIKFTIHAEQLDTVEAIRKVERQQGLLKRATSTVVDVQILASSDNFAKSREKAVDIILKTEARHESLIRDLPEGLCTAKNCEKFLKPNVFYTNIKVNEDVSVVVIEKILKQFNEYQVFLDQITRALDLRVKKTTQELIYLDILFLLLLLVVLLVQAVWGFKPAVKKLNEALSVRADFISRISHEIRNPMNSIMGMADILKSTKLTTEQKQYVNNLQRSSYVLLDMLNNLVDFAGLEGGAIELKKSKFNIYKLIDKVTDVVSVQAHEKNLELFVEVDPFIPKIIVGDVVRLEQVLLNLLINALKFTNKGHIFLNVARLPEGNGAGETDVPICFSVKDTGIGIEKEKLEEIFQSFVQEDSSIKRRFGGSGIGLSICKEIVGLMGSHINVISQKNRGSTFSFTVSLDRVSAGGPNDMKMNQNIIYLTEKSNTSVVESYLQKTTGALSVIDDVKYLESEVFRYGKGVFVIVDDSIGIINMIDAIAVIEKQLPLKKVFALMRSNFSKENMELIRKNGYKNFLIKPFRFWHLQGAFKLQRHLTSEFVEDGSFEDLKHEIKGRKLSILAVDDSNDNLFLLKEILSPITDQIDFAKNGLEACEQVSSNKYDLVFMDIQMPVMDGYSAIKKIRMENKKLPVYAVTAHAGIVDEKKCIEAGFTGRLTKPINRERVYNTIQSVFNIPVSSQKLNEDYSVEEKMLQKLMPAYFETRMEDLKTLHIAIDKQDYSTIAKVGHRIKGSAKSYGFEEIGDLSNQMEKAAIASNQEDCLKFIKKINDDILFAKAHYYNEV